MRRHWALPSALAMLAVPIGLAAPAGAAPAPAALGAHAGGQTPVPVGSAPRAPAGAHVVAGAPPDAPLHLSVTLAPQDPAALAAFVKAVSTPGSPSYHHFLAPGQFGTMFGASPESVAAVSAALQAEGLHPGPPSADRLSIPVDTTVRVAEAAFHTSLRTWRLASGRLARSETSAPELPASVAGDVQDVVGLSNLAQAVPQLAVHTGTAPRDAAPATLRPRALAPGQPAACSQASSAATSSAGYTPAQLAQAYGFSGLYSAGHYGAGVTVGVYELEPFLGSDISSYQSCYKTHAQVTVVPVDGGPGSTGAGSGEAALDIENVIGLAPEANVLVYDGPNMSSGIYDTYQAMIQADKAQVLVTSWGVCEAAEGGQSFAASTEALFEQAAAQGQTLIAAAGDSGSEDCLQASGSGALAVDDPASDPYVTGVGGTSLTSAGPPPAQRVWNDSATQDGAGGGGISSFWPMPSWQQTLGVTPLSSGAPCASSTYCREVPDVSASADPNHGYVIYWNGVWGSFGGTSGAAPLWAAVVADGESSCSSPTAYGFLDPSLYKAAQAGDGALTDVTTGENDYTGENGGLFPARAGYDMASGLGTPVASTLASLLCSPTGISTVPHDRLAGTNGTGTAIAISQTSFQTGSAQAVVLARSDMYPDALAGGPLAAKVHGPLLLTGTSALDPSTAQEIQRVLPPGGTVYLLGGTMALSTQVASQVKALGYVVQRVEGTDRYGTAAAVAAQLGAPSTAFLVTGANYPDALSIGPVAASMGAPILLTDGYQMPQPTSAWLSQHPAVTVYAVGGPACGADPAAKAASDCVMGQDRFGTDAAVAQRFFTTPPTVIGIATGWNFPDALSAGPYLASQGPLVLVNPTGPLPAPIASYLGTLGGSVKSFHVFGGSLAVSDQVVGEVNQALG